MGKMFNRFEKVANTWLAALDTYTMDELLKKPSDESWSIGQVYIHITTANKYFLGKNANALANGEGFETGKGKNKWGHLVFLLNMFPPVNVKMPKKDTGGTEPIQPESKEQIERKIKENLAFFKEMEEMVAKAPKNQTKKYPFLGYLNASEWYTLAGLHMKHHLRQKRKLDKFLGK
jgi:hypothetical protein